MQGTAPFWARAWQRLPSVLQKLPLVTAAWSLPGTRMSFSAQPSSTQTSFISPSDWACPHLPSFTFTWSMVGETRVQECITDGHRTFSGRAKKTPSLHWVRGKPPCYGLCLSFWRKKNVPEPNHQMDSGQPETPEKMKQTIMGPPFGTG